ncbi:unnamed protein product, partial [Lampetra fluviatilis]
LVYEFAHRYRQATKSQVTALASAYAKMVNACCSHEHRDACFDKAGRSRYLVHDELCEGVSSIPSAADCCSISNEEDRADCLSALHGNLSLPGVPFVSDQQLCHDRRWRSHDAFASLLWEFGRRHPRAADSQVQELAERFSHIADACCDLADEKECIAKKRAPNASYEQIAKLSNRFLAYADKCCGQGWSPGCFAEQ